MREGIRRSVFAVTGVAVLAMALVTAGAATARSEPPEATGVYLVQVAGAPLRCSTASRRG